MLQEPYQQNSASHASSWKLWTVFILFVLVLLCYSSASGVTVYNQGELQTAINNGDMDIVIDGFTVSTTITVNGVTAKITGGTMTRDASYTGALISIINGGSLEIDGGTIDGGGIPALESAVLVTAGSSFTLSSGSIINNIKNVNGDGGAVSVSDTGSTFTMNGGSISGCSSCRGGGVSVRSGATFTMNNGAITNNNSARIGTSGGLGGGVYVSTASTFTMKNGELSNNTATNSEGGGVAVNGGTFNLEGGIITGNTAIRGMISFLLYGGNGGGVWTSEGVNSVFNMTGGTVSGNTAVYGGGIQVNSTNVTSSISGGIISGNEAITDIYGSFVPCGYGGGVDVDKGGTLQISGTTEISGNTALSGGGISARSTTNNRSTLTITGSVMIMNNNATDSFGGGGGIFVPLRADVTVEGATIQDNTTAGRGGGVAVGLLSYSPSFLMTSGVLYSNEANDAAADFYCTSTSVVSLLSAKSDNMGLGITVVDNWYWDTNAARFAVTANPDVYPDDNSAKPLYLIAESLTTATPTPEPTSTPVVVVPQTGDSFNLTLYACLTAAALILAGYAVRRQYLRAKHRQ